MLVFALGKFPFFLHCAATNLRAVVVLCNGFEKPTCGGEANDSEAANAEDIA